MVDTPGHADFGGEVRAAHILFYDLDLNGGLLSHSDIPPLPPKKKSSVVNSTSNFGAMYNIIIVYLFCRLNELWEWWKELSWLLMLERDP